MTKPLAFVRLLRPSHAIKNFFVAVPLFFGGHLMDGPLLFKVLISFVSVTLMAGTVYVFNDILDVEADRKHAKKKLRPIAAGEVSPREAGTLALLTFGAALGLAWLVNREVLLAVTTYFCMNGLYSLRLKHVPILDVTMVSLGFVLRIFIGAFATAIVPSMWLVVMTFLIAMFLALAKRRDDVLIHDATGKSMRPVVHGYNLVFVDHAIVIMAAVVCVAYLHYTISPDVVNRTHAPYLYLTFFFVVVGILRYLQITFVHEDSGNPTQVILRDKPLIAIVLGWVAVFLWVLYF